MLIASTYVFKRAAAVETTLHLTAGRFRRTLGLMVRTFHAGLDRTEAGTSADQPLEHVPTDRHAVLSALTHLCLHVTNGVLGATMFPIGAADGLEEVNKAAPALKRRSEFRANAKIKLPLHTAS